jgi:hypothetical protein
MPSITLLSRATSASLSRTTSAVRVDTRNCQRDRRGRLKPVAANECGRVSLRQFRSEEPGRRRGTASVQAR